MQKLHVKEFIKISGISAASGIEFSEGQIYLISDNSNYLYSFLISEEVLTRQVLLEITQMDQIEKPKKLDLEAMLLNGDKIYTFGSGSTPARERGFSISKNDSSNNELDLSNLYHAMKISASIDPSDFNIEGAAVYGNSWLFLNRGNGPGGRNVIFKVDGDDFTIDFLISSFEINLPQIDGLKYGFSGATVIDNSLFFIATAEEGLSTYDDGIIGGTIFGNIDLKNMKIVFCQKISKDQKFEGITLLESQANIISFLMCEDNDGTSDIASIFILDLELT